MAVLTPNAKLQFININGQPLIGGRLYTYAAGTTTPLATYADAAATTTNPNPIILDARGEASVWLGANTYKFKLTDSSANEIWTVDYISAPISSISPVLSGNVTIDTNSSNPALQITQTGTGAAIKVQDSANPDITPFIVDASGNVGILNSAPNAALDIANNGVIQLTNNGTIWSVMSANAFSSFFSAVGAGRTLIFQTNSINRVTIFDTYVDSTIPIVLPANPTTALQAATKSYVDLAAPAGMIAPFAGLSAPTGWLACQGQAVSQTTYAALFAAIGTTWDIGGEGAGNFRLPDLRGMFLRGAGTNATGSSSGAVGQPVSDYATDTYLNHSHAVTDPGHNHQVAFTQNSFAPGSAETVQAYPSSGSYTTSTSSTGLTVNTSTTGDTETKPKNYGVLYIIKT